MIKDKIFILSYQEYNLTHLVRDTIVYLIIIKEGRVTESIGKH